MLPRSNNKTHVEPRFRLFFVSSATLLVALCALTYAEFYMEPSVEQEVIGLVAIVLGAISGFGVILAYLAILWARLKRFFVRDERE